MRLINTHSLELVDFDDRQAPPYAILSHRWGNGETTFKDFKKGRNIATTGYKKVQSFCKIVQAEWNLDWAWSDTACIDKRSSAELSEAINSMYKYYAESHICVIYLGDVDKQDLPGLQVEAKMSEQEHYEQDNSSPKRDLAHSEWFQRGWTLQELVAPAHAVFYDRNWMPLGKKRVVCDDHRLSTSILPDLTEEIAHITGIPERILEYNQRIRSLSIAQRLSFAAGRHTTRIEDRSYSLLGLLEINMPLLYGEGERAWIRLLDEIMKRHDDETIFAFDIDKNWSDFPLDPIGVLPQTPDQFHSAGSVDVINSGVSSRNTWSYSSRGLRLSLPAGTAAHANPYVTSQRDMQIMVLALNCCQARCDKPLVLMLTQLPCGHYTRNALIDIGRGHHGESEPLPALDWQYNTKEEIVFLHGASQAFYPGCESWVPGVCPPYHSLRTLLPPADETFAIPPSLNEDWKHISKPGDMKHEQQRF